jgi:acyl-CoA synthetase (AMP-forming)/AMP-acid ligase II
MLVAHGRRNRDDLDLRPVDRTPLLAPLPTTLGQAVLAHALCAGASLIIPPPGDLAAVWDAVASERPTWLSTSSGFLELLARHLADHRHERTIPTLRFVQTTAAAIAPETHLALERRLGAPILPRYSSTEGGGIAMTWPPPARRKIGSVGQPVQEVRIVGGDGDDVGQGREGEIWVRGPRVVSGYLDDPEATAAAFLPDGWFRTGDVGYLDADGFLFLTGRLDELINRGGEKIAPAEVDAVLQAHPALSEAAAFAIPDARLGEDIAAAVVVKPGAAIREWELRAWLLARLSPSKTPRRVWTVDALPRTATGKVQRRLLAERFSVWPRRMQ